MSLRLLRADEPGTARENVALRQALARLTLGTHDKARGSWVLKPCEAQALYEALAHRTFSLNQLQAAEAAIRSLDPHELDSDWDASRLESFLQAARRLVDRPEWIDNAVRRLYAAMRAQGSDKKFRLALCRAALVAFLTIDFLPNQPEELFRLAG